MAPRGLSAEEKRVKLLEILHETKDFYQLKELEKLGPKMKGIVSQSVKEVLQSLIDDGLAHGEKIGSSNFFWSFPSQNGAMMQNRLSTMQQTRDATAKQIADMKSSLETERALRIDTEERKAALDRLFVEKEQVVKLERELSAYGACDPAQVADKKAAVELAHEAAIRWTDNFSLALGYLVRQTGCSAADVRQQFGVAEDYEDIC